MEWNKENRENRNKYLKNRSETDLNFDLAHLILRARTNRVLKSQNVRKTNETFGLFGCSNSSSKNWIIPQLYGDVFFENYVSLRALDLTYPVSKTI